MGINKVILVGNVGKDPEIKAVGEQQVATFSIATSETFKKQDGTKVTNTEWHNLVIWGGLTKVVESYVKKGTPLYVEGKIRTRSWEGKDGTRRYTTEIVVNNLQLLGSKPESSNGSESDNTPPPLEPDDLPF